MIMPRQLPDHCGVLQSDAPPQIAGIPLWHSTGCECINDALKFRQGATLLRAESNPPSAPDSIVAALTFAIDFPF